MADPSHLVALGLVLERLAGPETDSCSLTRNRRSRHVAQLTSTAFSQAMIEACPFTWVYLQPMASEVAESLEPRLS